MFSSDGELTPPPPLLTSSDEALVSPRVGPSEDSDSSSDHFNPAEYMNEIRQNTQGQTIFWPLGVATSEGYPARPDGPQIAHAMPNNTVVLGVLRSPTEGNPVGTVLVEQASFGIHAPHIMLSEWFCCHTSLVPFRYYVRSEKRTERRKVTLSR